MTCLDDLLVSLPDDLLMMRQLHAVYGEWLLNDCRWDFVVDNVKGARIIFLGEGSTHAELLAMAQEDYNLDMSTESVEITYSLPAEMMQAPDTPPIHVTKPFKHTILGGLLSFEILSAWRRLCVLRKSSH
ncbi:hypothetical protein DY000_02046668 [Brassica cretica]|uniref:Uncharacterized protein n=1 Tax=Brassica cretica TaxID=69181 RepID=A0ABQ7F5P4_BRACR|nr:hypothetical protein DY000_02046668 [Brassica cretica]